MLNEIMRRNQLKEDNKSRSTAQERALVKILLGSTEKKSEQELLQLILDSCDDMSDKADSLQQNVEDYKNGVPFQAPPTEEQVLKTKKTLSSGIGAFFKSKQPASAVPDFMSIFIADDKAIDRA